MQFENFKEAGSPILHKVAPGEYSLDPMSINEQEIRELPEELQADLLVARKQIDALNIEINRITTNLTAGALEVPPGELESIVTELGTLVDKLTSLRQGGSTLH